MTISTTTNRYSYSGNGVTTAFNYLSKFLADGDLVVLLVNDTTGVSVTQVLTTNYTVTGAGADGGGTVTMLVAPPTGYTLVIYGDPAITQSVDLVDNDALPANTVEGAYDRLTLIAQRLKDRIDRAMRFAESDTSGASLVIPTPSSNKLLGWNSGASALENKAAADVPLTAVTSYILTLLDDANASAAQDTLGFSAFAKTLIDDASAGAALTTLGVSSFVQTLVDDTSASAARETLLIPRKNRIIGGDFGTNPWQRGTTFTAPASGANNADRWVYEYSGAGVANILKTADAPTASEAGVYTSSCLHLDVTTADAAIAATDLYVISQILEGYTVADLGFGQAGTRYITISFWVKSTITGTYCVSLRNLAPDRAYVKEYTVNVADTWERKTLTIPVDTTGTWGYVNGTGLRLGWTLAAGTNHQTTADTWETSDNAATANQVNAMSSAANNFKLALVQVEAGQVATDFEWRPWTDVLAQCQRYYEKSFPQGTAPAQNAGTEGSLHIKQIPGAGISTFGTHAYKVTKRTDPTVTFYNPSAVNAQARDLTAAADCSATAVGTNSNDALLVAGFTTAAGSALNNTVAVHWASDAEL